MIFSFIRHYSYGYTFRLVEQWERRRYLFFLQEAGHSQIISGKVINSKSSGTKIGSNWTILRCFQRNLIILTKTDENRIINFSIPCDKKSENYSLENINHSEEESKGQAGIWTEKK
jgi:hypothetical protein